MNYLDQLLKTGIIQSGHFVLSSGDYHSDYYVHKYRLFENYDIADNIFAGFAEVIKCMLGNQSCDYIVGMASGGIIPAYNVAKLLGCKWAYAEPAMFMPFDIAGKSVFMIEDVLTTGKTVKNLEKAIEEKGGRIIGLACIVDRSNDDVRVVKYQYGSLIKLDLKLYPLSECPLCQQQIPITNSHSA